MVVPHDGLPIHLYLKLFKFSIVTGLIVDVLLVVLFICNAVLNV